MMTEDELKEIEERANAAKPGPWKWNHLDDRDRTCLEYGSDKFDVISHGYTSYGYIDYSSYLDIDKSDATFIEHAREAEVRRLQQQLQTANEAYDKAEAQARQEMMRIVEHYKG